MVDELVYRFCVREKPTQERPEKSRPIFITRVHLSEAIAHERYEVIERLEHTARNARLNEALSGLA